MTRNEQTPRYPGEDNTLPSFLPSISPVVHIVSHIEIIKKIAYNGPHPVLICPGAQQAPGRACLIQESCSLCCCARPGMAISSVGRAHPGVTLVVAILGLSCNGVRPGVGLAVLVLGLCSSARRSPWGFYSGCACPTVPSLRLEDNVKF